MNTAAVLRILVEANTAQADAALMGTDAKLKSTAATAAATSAATTKNWSKAAAGMSTVGKGMTKFITVPALAIGAASIKASLDFNKSMTLIQTQAGASASEVENMKKQVLDFAASGQTDQGPKQLADGLYAVESAGIRGSRAMDTLRSASNLAMIGQADFASTTKALVAAQKTGIRGSADLNQEIGTLNATVGAGQMHMDDLVSAMGTGFLSSAKAVGLALPDVGASLAELTKQGIPASSAATRLRMAFTLMAAPTSKAITALGSIGLQQDTLAKTMRNQGLIPALQTLQDHLSGLSKVKQVQVLSSAFGGARSGSAILALLGNMKDLKSTLDQIHTTSGNVNQSLAAAKANSAEELKIAWAQVQASLVRVGDVLIPVVIPALQDVAAGAADIANAFAGLPKPLQEVVVGVTLIAAAVGPVLVVTSSLIKAWITVREAILGASAAEAIFGATGAAAGAATEVEAVGAAASGVGVDMAMLTGELGGAGTSMAGLGFMAADAAIPLAAMLLPVAGLYLAFGRSKTAGDRFNESLKALHDNGAKMVDGMNKATDGAQKFAAAQKTTNQLLKEGKTNSQAFAKGVNDEAAAFNEQFAGKQEQQKATQATLKNVQDLKASLVDFRQQVKTNPFQFLNAGMNQADIIKSLAQAQNSYNDAIINYKRNTKGIASLAPQTNAALDQIRGLAGKKVTAQIGVSGSDQTVQAIGTVSSQLQKLGVGKNKIIKILGDGKNASAEFQKLLGLLNQIHDKRVKVQAGGSTTALVAIKALMDSIQSKIVTVTIVGKKVGDIAAATAAGYAKGTKSFKGGSPAIVNEEGPELARLGGKMWMLGNGKRGAQLAAVPQGAQIFTASETRHLMSMGIPAFKKGKMTKSERKQLKQTKAQARYDSVATNLEANLSGALLTPDTADDIAALNQLIAYYQGIAKNNKYANKIKNPVKREAALTKLKDALDNIKQYTDQMAEITGANGGSSGDNSAAAQALADLNAQQATTNAQRYAVSQAQYGVLANLPYGGSFGGGGVIPGPIGAPVAMVGHGGETVTPHGGNELRVIHEDNRTRYVLNGKEVKAQERKTARRSRRNLAGQAGTLRG